MIKFIAMLKPVPINMPATIGAKTAPNLPAPIPHPTPVVLNSVGYILAATEYKPTIQRSVESES